MTHWAQPWRLPAVDDSSDDLALTIRLTIARLRVSGSKPDSCRRASNPVVQGALAMSVKKGSRVVFYTDGAHIQKDRGIATGKVHTAWTGGYNGHEIVVHGQLRSVPFWRFAEVRS